MHLAVLPHALVQQGRVPLLVPCELTIAVGFAIVEAPLIDTPIRVGLHAMALSYVLDPLSLINLARLHHITAFAITLTISPLAEVL